MDVNQTASVNLTMKLQTSIAELHALISQPPTEPFRDLPRRPNGYRETPAYQAWEADTGRWQQQIADLAEKGLRLCRTEDRAAVRWYDAPLPDADFTLRANGALTPSDGQPTPPLPLPPARQKLQTFLAENRKTNRFNRNWDLQKRFHRFLQSLELNLPPAAANLTLDHIRETERQWLTHIRDLLDPQLRSRTRQAAGPTLKLTLCHYNLTAQVGEPLRRLQHTNPGAVAWYLGHPDPQEAGSPGEIVTAVRRQFDAAGGNQRHWKILVAQPAADTGILMQRYGPEGAAFIVNAMGDAPIRRLPRRPDPRPPSPEPVQNSLFGPTEPLRASLPPAAPEPTRYRQPPLPLKLALLHACGRRRFYVDRYEGAYRIFRPGGNDPHTMERAYQNVARLAVRQLADYPERAKNSKRNREYFAGLLTDLVDFAIGDPERASRCTTWGGLKKASQAWHRDAVRRAALEQANAEQRNAAAAQRRETAVTEPWQSLIGHHQADGWHARALLSYQELAHEAATLRHCVGSSFYAEQCQDGYTRIFRLQPDGISPDNQAAQRRWATTLELVLTGDRWHIRQHRGYLNRQPTEAEQQQAAELLRSWRQAVRDQAVTDQAPQAA